jgi:hypothetical protein
MPDPDRFMLPVRPTDPNLDPDVRRFMQIAGPWLNSLIANGYWVIGPGGTVIPANPSDVNFRWFPLFNALNYAIG